MLLVLTVVQNACSALRSGADKNMRAVNVARSGAIQSTKLLKV